MSGSEWQIINMKILRKLSKIAAISNWLLVSATDWLRGKVSLAPLHSQFENLAFYISFMKAFEVFEHMKPSTWRHLILEDFKFFEQVFRLTASRVFQTSGLHQSFKSSWRLPCLVRLDSEGSTFSEENVDSVAILKIENSRNWAYS